jgi:hypothetical protein
MELLTLRNQSIKIKKQKNGLVSPFYYSFGPKYNSVMVQFMWKLQIQYTEISTCSIRANKYLNRVNVFSQQDGHEN